MSNNLYRELHDWVDPLLVAKRLIEIYGEPGLIWLDSDNSKNGRWIILAVDPIEYLSSRGLPQNPLSSNPFELLRSIDTGHWCGWLSYEAGAWIEPTNPWKTDSMATLWMARHDPVLKFDLYKKELWLEGSSKKRFSDLSKVLKDLYLNHKLTEKTQNLSKKSFQISKGEWEWLTNQKEFIKAVEILKKYIEKGDIFQANLSACCKAKKIKNVLAIEIFQILRKSCPAPFSGVVVATGDSLGEAIISTSPERFLKVLPNNEIETRPIKGTRPRHKNPQKDSALAADLITNEKDRAENIMIVDLLRNDIGKVCQPGTIEVTKLVDLESYTQVHHLTSVIKGTLNDDKTWVDLLQACWPGGSITGAPKIRACQRLYELEPIARGPYCGSLLHLDWDGQFDSNILIRSLMIDKESLRLNAGCGIVADSNPYTETEELKWKIMPLIEALE
ncbi:MULTISPECIES: anthranilate synthase component I family protein [unclassified Prochlorococcus]|uniref:anthranilate synthase component I family protein n=1 Tax=unclassified Prochlorococcus TaxID=2627481 RepID=UPI000533B2C4|nr:MULTISPECIES: anthranilate synthase component I family protein [unclassified Prochlorococcus]KGG14527.1 Para-aminobenzoate synthase [Prochlorococcus sp. MIT 0602]KGG16048.1 Para-aminobenzoate synthase [Prochlorococcus sp. MIT 0603]